MSTEIINSRPRDIIQPLSAELAALERKCNDDLSSAVQEKADGMSDYEAGALYGLYVSRHEANWDLPATITGYVHEFRSSVDRIRNQTTGLSTVPESYEAEFTSQILHWSSRLPDLQAGLLCGLAKIDAEIASKAHEVALAATYDAHEALYGRPEDHI